MNNPLIKNLGIISIVGFFACFLIAIVVGFHIVSYGIFNSQLYRYDCYIEIPKCTNVDEIREDFSTENI